MLSSKHRRRRSSLAEAAIDPYAPLAGDYHWLLDENDLRLGTRTPGVRVALSSLEPGARVLDAACGVGVDAAVLVRRGLRVTIADASASMLCQAADRLAAEGIQVDAVHSRWDELPTRVPAGAFDAILCSGNSIGHVRDEAEMITVFESFASVLAPGGMVVLDTHDWEYVCSAGNRVLVEPRVLARNGRRCLRTYVWHVPTPRPQTVELELCFVFLDGESASSRTHMIEMHPFTRRQLRDRLQRAGFRNVALDAIPGHDRYTATARRS